MDALLSFLWRMPAHLMFNVFFFCCGWLVIKCVTLGRYPRTINFRHKDCADYELVAMAGMLTIVALVIFFTYLK